MADEKVNMGPEENKAQETLSPPGQGEMPSRMQLLSLKLLLWRLMQR